MKTILITGGAGYVGSHDCRALAQAGCTPVCYDCPAPARQETLKSFDR